MVDSVSPLGAAGAGLSTALGAGQVAEQAKAASAESDFDDFLTLLTSQLRNQDPLQPLDSTQFVEQLASFSAVEQQVGMNARLDTLIGQGSGSEIGALAAWLGREVEGTGIAYRFDGSALEVTPPGDGAAQSAAMAVLNAEGEEIARVPFDPEADRVSWNGQTAEGLSASPGLYTLQFHYAAEGREPWRREGASSGRVTEALVEGDGARLVFESGASLPLDRVTRIAEG